MKHIKTFLNEYITADVTPPVGGVTSVRLQHVDTEWEKKCLIENIDAIIGIRIKKKM